MNSNFLRNLWWQKKHRSPTFYLLFYWYTLLIAYFVGIHGIYFLFYSLIMKYFIFWTVCFIISFWEYKNRSNIQINYFYTTRYSALWNFTLVFELSDFQFSDQTHRAYAVSVLYYNNIWYFYFIFHWCKHPESVLSFLNDRFWAFLTITQKGPRRYECIMTVIALVKFRN